MNGPGDVARAAILAAAEVGYRAFDTAQIYGNEAEIGEALQASGIPREEFCITTKANPDNFGEDRFMASVEQSLRDLRIDCVDVLLVHWPPTGGDIAPSPRLLRRALDTGMTRNIGVSNYTVAMMRGAVSIIDAPLVANQVEFHPLLNQDRLLAGANEIGIIRAARRGGVRTRPRTRRPPPSRTAAPWRRRAWPRACGG